MDSRLTSSILTRYEESILITRVLREYSGELLLVTVSSSILLGYPNNTQPGYYMDQFERAIDLTDQENRMINCGLIAFLLQDLSNDRYELWSILIPGSIMLKKN